MINYLTIMIAILKFQNGLIIEEIEKTEKIKKLDILLNKLSTNVFKIKSINRSAKQICK